MDTQSEIKKSGSPMSASRTIHTGELGNMAWTGSVGPSRSRRPPCRGGRPGSGKPGGWLRIVVIMVGRTRAIIRPGAAGGNPERRCGANGGSGETIFKENRALVSVKTQPQYGMNSGLSAASSPGSTSWMGSSVSSSTSPSSSKRSQV